MKKNECNLYEQVELETFPVDDTFYSLAFVVPKEWLIDMLERMDALNNREGVDLQRFLENYIWDETYFLYSAAQAANVIIREENKE